ncbi:glycosyltransferase family protein [Microbacterium binotii]|uniref:glycosyltransferase family protein n=1 Tax=Microbacterium binotii TaxID=462710 RepID=UPI001F349D76|nr:glycosyltransferase [Microbacterium binotii]UIN29860.1 hypothetical protein LXM64_12000 [Microbacterium binotii]
MSIGRSALRAVRRRVLRSREERRWARVLLASQVTDVDFYARIAGLTRAISSRHAIQHYLRHGRFRGLTLNPLIDPVVLAASFPSPGAPPLCAYLDRGGPHPHVSTVWDAPLFAEELGETTSTGVISAALRAVREEPDRLLPLREPGRTLTAGELYAILAASHLPAQTTVPPHENPAAREHMLLVARAASPYFERRLEEATDVARDVAVDVTIVLVAPTPAERAKVEIVRRRSPGLRAVIAETDVAVVACLRTQTHASAAGVTVLVDLAYDPDRDELRALAEAAAHVDGAAIMPLSLGPDGTVLHAGGFPPAHGGDAYPLLRGLPADDARALGGSVEIPMITGPNLAAATDILRDGLDVERVHAVSDIGAHLRGRGYRAYVRTEDPWRVPFLAHPPRPARAASTADVQDGLRPYLAPLDLDLDQAGRVVRSPASAPTRLRWAIKTAAPADRAAARSWGDLHFAEGLAAALRRLDQHVVIDSRDSAERPTSDVDDVVVVIRGLYAYVPPASATSLLWVISHPDQVLPAEARRYDAVFAASAPWARRMSQEWGVRIEPLLQATSPERFRPSGRPRTDGPLFVGNSRGVDRPIVRATAERCHDMRVYGGGWEGVLPPSVVRGEHAPNDELPAMYESALYVVNDHWPEMQRDGFISNRLFDVVAAGGRALSDSVEGVEELFGGAVAVAHSDLELNEMLSGDADALFADDAALARVSDRIRREHSFDSRARTLLDAARTARAGDVGVSDCEPR